MAKARFQRTITDESGNVAASAEITVVDESTGTNADLYEDRDGNTSLSNPFTTGEDGFAEFYADSGTYRITADASSGTITWRYVPLTDTLVEVTWGQKQTFSGGLDAEDDVNVTGDVDVTGGVATTEQLTEFSGDVTEWDSGTGYDEGDLVRRAGIVFAATGSVSSDPLNPANYADWYPSRTVRELIHHALTAEPIDRELHPIHDVNAGTYVQHLLVNRATLDGTEYEFDLVHLDGTQISGDADLEAIFDPDGTEEYPFLSLIAEEDAGTWTLKDHAGTFTGAQTSGGERDDIGEVGESQMQRITGNIDTVRDNNDTYVGSYDTEGALSVETGNNVGTSTSGSADSIKYKFDSANSPDARASSSTDGETRPAYATTGIPAIIVMREAAS